MRLAAMITAAVLASAGAAVAQTPSVTVAIGPELQEKADKYGQRELDFLAEDLRKSVSRRLAGDAGRLELVLVDATPNRPTFEELSDRPGLSLMSYGVGGATIEGVYIAPDGSRVPVSYRWYENDIRWARNRTTWGDAEDAFDKLANRLATQRVSLVR